MARSKPPVLILGSLDGIETGVRQLIREQPLETRQIEQAGHTITVPTQKEILRIKAVLILKRNATRDYLDFAALADDLGHDKAVEGMQSFDELYPQTNGESALQQLQIQISKPLPYDLEKMNLSEYKHLDQRWHDWKQVEKVCSEYATVFFDRIIGQEEIQKRSEK